ncbi:mRNA triphosphatase CET1 [Auriscalpium vulgare]|uniref:mRNA triphosphatase CET1 n=1 Tax=Auriscalpium vulgare TaxID=40419 RepID=A0ACB8S3I4_9AGAM|nr:mRNA triphosphatase CET1 [Auriscalpium vulgare]
MSSLPPLSPSILGVEPLDEFIREVADFIHHTILNRPPEAQGQIEVEAKVGVLRDKQTGRRIALPVLTETILAPNEVDSRFESNMTAMQHKHYNTLLNNLKATSDQPGYSASPLAYAHLHLVDSFFSPDNSRGRDKIRVTRDEKTGDVRESLKKIRLASLDIYSPKRAVDWRISVNMEVPVPLPLGSPTHTRRKDRISYSHEAFSIDLTQVTSSAGANQPAEILHELEVEFAHSDLLLATASKRGDPNVPEQDRYAFDELIRAFVNNARILVRNAGDGWQ